MDAGIKNISSLKFLPFLIANSKISFKFVVPFKFISYEVLTTKNAETKSKGRRMGASPTVISVPRMDLGGSDLPPLFNQNHFIMPPNNDKCGTCADRPLTAQLIIDELIKQADMALFEEGLHNLFLKFVEQEEDLSNDDYKNDVVYTYIVLRNLIKDVDKLKKLQKS